MQESKLIQLLKSLSREEFLQFRKVLQSPFFVANDIPLKLYDGIRRYYPDFDSQKLQKIYIFHKIYPHRIYDDNRMRDMMRKLTQLLKDYLVWNYVKEDAHNYQNQLIKAYAKRNLFDSYQKGRNKLLHDLDGQAFRGSVYYQDFVELHHQYYYHPQRPKINRSDSTLQQLIGGIDKRFIINKLRLAIEVRNQERLFQKEYHLDFLDEVLSKAQQYEDHFTIQILWKLYETYSGNDAAFVQLEALFFLNVSQLESQDAQLIYFYILNYINRKVNKGQTPTEVNAFAWYKFGLQEGWLIKDGKISEVSFGNMVIYACRQQAFSWTKTFINNYGKKIQSANVEDNIQFNLGVLHFYKGELETAFSLLDKYHFHASFQLKIRLISLRVLFEQFLLSSSYFDAMISYAKAFQKFLQREDLYAPTVAEPLKRTIEVIKSLAVKIMNRERKSTIQHWLKHHLERNQNIIVKYWLIKKVDNLK